MMIASNFHVRYKEEAQGEGEEEAGDERKGDRKLTTTSGADVPISLLRSGMWDARGRRKYATVVCGYPPQEGRRGLKTSPILSR